MKQPNQRPTCEAPLPPLPRTLSALTLLAETALVVLSVNLLRPVELPGVGADGADTYVSEAANWDSVAGLGPGERDAWGFPDPRIEAESLELKEARYLRFRSTQPNRFNSIENSFVHEADDNIKNEVLDYYMAETAKQLHDTEAALTKSGTNSWKEHPDGGIVTSLVFKEQSRSPVLIHEFIDGNFLTTASKLSTDNWYNNWVDLVREARKQAYDVVTAHIIWNLSSRKHEAVHPIQCVWFTNFNPANVHPYVVAQFSRATLEGVDEAIHDFKHTSKYRPGVIPNFMFPTPRKAKLNPYHNFLPAKYKASMSKQGQIREPAKAAPPPPMWNPWGQPYGYG